MCQEYEQVFDGSAKLRQALGSGTGAKKPLPNARICNSPCTRSLRRGLENHVMHFHAERNRQGKGNIILLPAPADRIGQPLEPFGGVSASVGY
jgi:hypothetical protein